MTSTSFPVENSNRLWLSAFYRIAYQAVGYFGLFSIFAAILYGFRYDPAAPATNLTFNVMLYGAFIVPHLVMTRSWFKRIVWGTPYSTPRERRFYVLFTTVTWLAAMWFQRPIPGAALALPEVAQFAGTVCFLICILVFFQGITFDLINGMLEVPGAVSSYSHGPETPLFTEGPYAEVRHPMYRGALLAGVSALAIHPNAGQLLWTVMIGLTFILFIPVEEAQMIAARGDDYRSYQRRTPYRLFKGIW
jgi:protein-S-isoprenylcysteine O-methyltransferase Ste14